ncbi:hypothetical protein [Halioxenophilus sp. WMMB6]|uniref:hypothetical protein n=1 Tax=Halioxenophilus sp. WMMB6 TaxID=3073815 RepID=UPI00295E2D02|nr:hypothetical protein [Halioxenophilus sp. WMMB6]
MIFEKNKTADADNTPWVIGQLFNLAIPADAETLLADGCAFLTRAFQSAGTLAANNRVSQIITAEEFVGGGTGKKLLLTVAYAVPASDLPEQLFIKFSRNFTNELADRARFMMISEANFAVLSRAPDFPVTVPRCLFADVESSSGTGLIITECISYGHQGVEPFYPKCMDSVVPEPLEHYTTIVRALARLAGAHASGRLSPEFDKRFPYNPKRAGAMLTLGATEEKLLERAGRMFDFIARYPRLVPGALCDEKFQQQFIADLPALVAAEEKVRARLFANPAMIAFNHWNANIDNCWFWRDALGELQCGFLDWANAGPMSVAQSINGVLSGADLSIWNQHLEELLTTFITAFARAGGPSLELDELRLQVLLIVALSGVAYAMNAGIAIAREIENLEGVQGAHDDCFRQHDNARIQLHMMTRLLSVWQTHRLGDLIREL